jgi:two-component system, LuxR family, response regulator FixJ
MPRQKPGADRPEALEGTSEPVKRTRKPVQASSGGFTQREEQVLRRLAWGYPIKTIARDLGISAKTVEFHKSAAMKKADLGNRVELLRLAVARGWMRREP